MSVGSSSAVIVERITAPVRGMHRVISSSWFDRIGPISAPVRGMHDAITELTYETILAAASGIGPLFDPAIADDSSAAYRLRAVVNSLWGDDLGIHGERVEIPMKAGAATSKDSGRDVEDSVADGRRVVILVHGLSDTEAVWSRDTEFLSALDSHPSVVPITIRYNPGLPIRDNAERFAALIADLSLPNAQRMDSLVLVGYSMGGLVIDRAIEVGRVLEQPWVEAVSDVVTIGAPHAGSPIENVVGRVARELERARVTRPLAEFLDTRSAGIRDLGHPPDVDIRDHRAVDARFHFVGGTITRNPDNPIGALVGDLVVPTASSTRADHRPSSTPITVGGSHHVGLIQNPDVIAHTMRQIDAPD